MGMSLFTFGALLELKNHLVLYYNKKPKILFLSYPDILVSKDDLEKVVRVSLKNIPYREDSKEILNWHKGFKKLGKIVETVSLFELLGFDVSVGDIVSARGCETYINLNESNAISSKYDIIFDNVLHHVFNCGEGIKNIAQACSLNGFIYHHNTYMAPNSGFHNFSVEFYKSFYILNGFEIYSTVVGNKYNNWVIECLQLKGPALLELKAKTKIACIVKKIKIIDSFIWPIQQKFITYPDSKKKS